MEINELEKKIIKILTDEDSAVPACKIRDIVNLEPKIRDYENDQLYIALKNLVKRGEILVSYAGYYLNKVSNTK